MNRFYKVSRAQFIYDMKRCFSAVDYDYLFSFESANTMYEEIKLPERKTAHSAGYDFFLPLDIELLPYPTTLQPKGTLVVPTGIKCELDEGFFLQMHIRSSIGIKHGVILSNATGIIDADYFNNPANEGHIMFALRNLSPSKFSADAGSAIAQGIISRYYTADDDTADGKRVGGIGSTGI